MLGTELRNRIEMSFGVGVSVVDLLGEATVASLTQKILHRMNETVFLADSIERGAVGTESIETVLRTTSEANVEDLIGRVESMSDEEVSALLKKSKET